MDDIIEDLKSIHHLNLFRVYIKENFIKEKYKYLTGYQKFIALCNDFKKEHNPKLDIKQKEKVENYSESLYKKTVDVFDWINWEVQTGCDIYDKKISIKLFKVFGEEPKDIEVLERIGRRSQLLNLCNHNKVMLRDMIYKNVEHLTLVKLYPQLENKSDDKKMIERLKNA